MSVSRVKVWTAEELYYADLNAEFDNLINNATSLISPLTANLAAGGFKLTGLGAGSAVGESLRYEQLFTTSAVALLGALDMVKGANIASASTINLTTATGNIVHVTGTTTITAVTLGTGMLRLVVFDGILTLTHHATNNNLPGTANITTAANDRALYWSDGTTVYCMFYQRADWSSPPFVDTNPVVVGSADATKKVRFEVDGLTTATTRVVTVPDKDGTMAMTGDITSIILGTPQATTSGTSKDFAIASGVKLARLMLVGVSTNGTAPYRVQLQDATSLKTSGYLSDAWNNGGTLNSVTSGFLLNPTTDAGQISNGHVNITLENAATFTYVVSGSIGSASFGNTFTGRISLVSELTSVRITMDGVDAFDAGAANTQSQS